MGFIEQLGSQAAAGIMGIALQGQNDRRQREQQQDLQNMQIRGNKEMMDYSMMKQMEMWKNTNFQAQIAQMKAAGLSPGLIYGMKGGGGITTGSPTGVVSGANAPVGGGEIQSMMGMGMQLQLLQAQKENIEADTKLKQADTTKTSGVDTEKATTEIHAIAQGIKNAKAQEEILKIDAILKNMEIAFQRETFDDRTDMIMYSVDQAKQALDRGQNQFYIERATRNAIIDTIRTQATEAILKNALLEAQTDKTRKGIEVDDAQIKKWAKEITQAQQGLDRQEAELALKAWESEIRANFPGISQSLGRILTGAMEELRDKFPGTPSRGFTPPKR